MTLVAANGGGSTQYGAIQKVLAKYKKFGFDFVTRRNLDYRMMLHLSGKDLIDERPCPNKITTGVTAVSSLTSNSNDRTTTSTSENRLENECETTNTLKKQKKEKKNLQDEICTATTNAANKYAIAKDIAKRAGKRVEKGLLSSIIKASENDAGLSSGLVVFETVRSRLKNQNISGVAPQRRSPLEKVEPIIVEHCVRLAEIGSALIADEVIALASEIIEGTMHETNLLEYKEKRNIISNSLLGKAWYHGFMKRNEDKIKRARCKVRDQKRLTWCTVDNFENMCDSV